MRNLYFTEKVRTVVLSKFLFGLVSFLVFIIMSPPLGLIITEFTLQNIITVLCL